MLSHVSKLKTLSLAALLSATALQSAWAWEAEAVAERYKALLGQQGVEVDWSGVRRDGDAVVLEGHRLGMTGIDTAVELGDLVLEDVSETEHGYRIGRVGMDRFTYTAKASDFDAAAGGADGAAIEFALAGLVINGLALPGEGMDDPYGGMMQYETFTLDEMTVGPRGQPLFTASDMSGETVVDSSAGRLAFTGVVDRFQLDAKSLAKDDKALAALKEYGFEALSGRADMAGYWQPQDGRMALTRYDATLDNAGTLAIKADISGYTPDFIKALRDIQKRMQDAPQEQQQAQGLAMLGLMQQLNLHGASIRFSDASLTGKVLDYVAEQQGVQPGDIANQAKAIVPLMAGQYLGPELTQSLSKAITAYLDDPRNLEIRLAPAEPMPLAVLMGTAMGSPEALAKQVGLEVLANE